MEVDGFFREKLLVLMKSTNSSHTALMNFLFFSVFVVFFIVIRLVVMTY